MIASPKRIDRFRKSIIIFATLILSFFCNAKSFSQIVEPTKEALAVLDETIKNYLEENNIPGGLVAVASRGEIVHLRSYGMANVELAVPVSDQSVFEIGSISKQFVSAVAMLLVEEG